MNLASCFSSGRLPRRMPFASLIQVPIQQRPCRVCRLSSDKTSSSFESHATTEETQMTADCRQLFDAAIQAVNPTQAVFRHLHLEDDRLCIAHDNSTTTTELNLNQFTRILVIAFGKASSAMAAAVVDRLANHAHKVCGMVIVKDNHATLPEIEKLQKFNITVAEASHPISDQRSVDASVQLLGMVQSLAAKDTLTLSCISGGGSALFCAPHERLELSDLQQTNQVLLESGWSIQDMNVLRKRLDVGKGGRLAKTAHPSTVVSLILSDVLGDPLDLIASGPTVPDTSSWRDAWSLVQRLPNHALPGAVLQFLNDGITGKLDSTPDATDKCFEKCTNIIVGNNFQAVVAAADKANKLGYHPVILGSHLEGEACEVARVFVAMAQHLRGEVHKYAMTPLPAALIAGGETTVSLPANSHGRGGRNQELALAAAIFLRERGLRQVVVGSIGTDGTDGPTNAAGAIVDGGTIDRLDGDAHDALRQHDAYPYLEQHNGQGHSPLVKTGPTGTNVADVYIVLVH